MTNIFEKIAADATAAYKLTTTKIDASVTEGLMLLSVGAIPFAGPDMIALPVSRYAAAGGMLSRHVELYKEALLATPGGDELLKLIEITLHSHRALSWLTLQLSLDPHQMCDLKSARKTAEGVKAAINDTNPKAWDEASAVAVALTKSLNALLKSETSGSINKPPPGNVV